MPDGRDEVEGREIVYKNVTRKHAGNYICQGMNGPGQSDEDSVKVNILRMIKVCS